MSTNLFTELWQRRSLIILFALNDVKLRYKNSVLGFFWTFLEPLFMLTILYFVFSHMMKSGIKDFPLFLLLGLIIWYMFSRGTTAGLSSLIDRAGILQKVYFRREIVVVSACLTAFIMMTFEFASFVVFMGVLQFVPPLTSIFLPLLLIDLFVLTLGISLFLSVLNVYFRDIRFIWQVLLQAGFFLTPIFYKLDLFPEKIRQILELNPLVQILDTAHNIVIYGNTPSLNSVAYIIGSTLIIFVIGFIVFRIKDKRIVEEL